MRCKLCCHWKKRTIFNRIFCAYSIIMSNNFLTVFPVVKQNEDKCLQIQLLKSVLEDRRLLFCYFIPNNFLHYSLFHQWCHIIFSLLLIPFFRKPFSCIEGLPGTIFFGIVHTFIPLTLPFSLLLSLLVTYNSSGFWAFSKCFGLTELSHGSIWISRRWLIIWSDAFGCKCWETFFILVCFFQPTLRPRHSFSFHLVVSSMSSRSLYEQIKNLQDIFRFNSISWRERISIFPSICLHCIIKLLC